jgi:ATP-dependent helicase HrpA
VAAVSPTAALRARLAELTVRDEHRLRRRLERIAGREDPEARGAALSRLLADADEAEARIAARRTAVPRISYPPELPVSARREELLQTIRDHQVVVVAGETGSGKTTQLPKICLELGRGIRGGIAHTQPRRLAARTVAERIADELGVPLGSAVGYAVRFNDRSSEDTLIRLVTDGLLLAEIRHDRLLRRYDTIIVDEAHERSLNIDFLLGYLKEILPRRPDLKLIITSATIDPGRFSRHFGDAPVVEVSGRTYPVEVRYRPLAPEPPPDDTAPAPERDPIDAIGEAVDELLAEGPGDVLVFLSGEREIRDTAEALRGRLQQAVEVLPLYARLSSAEQQRVFRPHGERRVVLATNVAETSLTVPGIRYVVDPGTARISRYSSRLKVQRLPIEAISQASADQRKGRCGRTSDGICIRLYSEGDFEARPRFTDPEVQRTNLASVLLQMASLDLGDVGSFGFLDPPDRRQVRDGVALLEELGAVEPGSDAHRPRLTQTGRRLAQLPVDPRLGRMVLEADRRSCADEVIVIAAALSIQDPRERPVDRTQAADERHARFSDPDEASDFLALLNLWRYLRELQRELSGNQFRKRCKAEFLHHLRIREWQDLVAQLRQAARQVGVTLNHQPGDARHIHLALISGLLSHIGLRDAARREYQGARGARFALFPGSSLARRQPSWVVVAELVETSRLFGRTAARIQPGWVEPLAGHLLKRTWSEPRWDRRRASVVATERATLYGLPIVAGRTVAYGPIDPAVARELFIRHALVDGDWDAPHGFLDANRRRIEEVRALEDRVRRRDLLVGDEALVAFFDARVPARVVSGAHFDRWWKDARREDPDLLTYSRELLLGGDAAGVLDPRARPEAWRQGETTLRLSYRFDPGAAEDGVTVHVPLAALGALRPTGFEWLVPALRHELVVTLLRALPKELRRPLVPIPDAAEQLLARIPPRSGPLLDVLAGELERMRGVRVPAGTWDLTALPAHLRMTFRIEDEDGTPLAEGADLAALREQLRPRLRERLVAAAPQLERHGLRGWELGTLPREVAVPGTGDAVRAYPALVDEGDAVGVRVLDTLAAQAATMRAGTRRLLALTMPSPVRFVQDRLPLGAQLALAGAPYASPAAVLEDAAAAAIDALVAEAGGPAWDAAGFARLRDHVAGELADRTAAVVAAAVRVLDLGREVQGRLDALDAEPLQEARADVQQQLDRLVHPGFVTEAGAARLPDVARYLEAAARRLERLPTALGTDRDRAAVVRELQELLDARRPGHGPLPPGLEEVRWLLEELRVSLFAQALGTRRGAGTVSAKRIRRLLEAAPAPAGVGSG